VSQTLKDHIMNKVGLSMAFLLTIVVVSVFHASAIAAVSEEPPAEKQKQEASQVEASIKRWFPEAATAAKPMTFRSLATALDKSGAEPAKCPKNWKKQFTDQVLVCAHATDIAAAKQAFVDAFSWLGSPGLMWSPAIGKYKMPKFLDWSDYAGKTWSSRVMVPDEVVSPVIYLQDDGMLFVTLKLN